MYELEDLIAIYAEYNEISINESFEMYDDGRISKKDLLEAYLHNESIWGYTDTLWNIFEILK